MRIVFQTVLILSTERYNGNESWRYVL